MPAAQPTKASRSYNVDLMRAAVVQAVVQSKATTISEVARKANIAHETAKKYLKDPQVLSAIEIEKVRHGDKARRIAEKGLGLLDSGATAAANEDPLTRVQVGVGVIKGSAEFQSGFGTTQAPTRSPAQDIEVAFRLMQALVVGISIGRSLDGRAERCLGVLDKLRERLQSVECKALSKVSVR